MEEASETVGPLARLHKMTRSISFKIHGTSKEHSHAHPSRRGPQPKKLNTESWVKGRQATGTKHVKETPPDLSRLGCNIGDKKSLWAKKAEVHKEKQSLNPFSDSFDADKLRKLLTNKDDPNYGRPDSGSLSAMRAAAGEAKMRSDICDVCDVIFQHGQRTEDGLAAIQFGPLFTMYNRINDKLVGLLIRARKRDLVHFEGEMLYQNRDDEKWVVLSKSINSIHAYFGRSSDVPGGGQVEAGVQDNLVFRSNSTDSRCSSVDASRRNSKVSICSMPPLCLGPKSPLCGKATVSTSPDIHFDSSCNTPDIQAAEALDQFPSDEKGLDTAAAATLDVKNSGGSSHSPSKMSAKGLRNSFRKLVKPLVKKRNTEVDEGDGDGGSEESLLSRVGSSRRGSKATTCLQAGGSTSKMQPASSCAALEQGASGGSELRGKGVEAKWKKVLGVSMAIGRMARMAGVSPEDPDERPRDQQLYRRGSSAL